MKQNLAQNTGFLPSVPTGSDYIAGAVSKIIYEIRNEKGDWKEDLPLEEKQFNSYMDSMACVTFSAMNSLETQLNQMLRLGKIPQWLIKWLRDEGYLDDKVNFSDRFIAKLSGMTANGNTFQKVWDTIRHCGLLPEKDWTFKENFNWGAYYASIPQTLKDKALKFLKYFDIQYEWVRSQDGVGTEISFTSIDKELKQAPLQFASATCPGWNDTEIIQACNFPCGHAYMGSNLEDLKKWIDIFDTYDPYRKRLSADYHVPYIMKGLISIRTQEIKCEQIRWAWNADPQVKETYPSPNFQHITIADYTIFDWARDYGVYDHEEFFTSGFRGEETILRIVQDDVVTNLQFIYGPGGGPVTSESQLEGLNYHIEDISPENAKALGLDVTLPIPTWLKKNNIFTIIWQFLKRLFSS